MGYRTVSLGALAILVAACQADGLGPEPNVLLGAFGAAEVRTELWATHMGIELDDACTYFSSSEPAVIGPDGSFAVDGRYHGNWPVVGTTPARLAGQLKRTPATSTVALTLTLLDARPPAVQPTLVLTRNLHYTGEPFPCPA